MKIKWLEDCELEFFTFINEIKDDCESHLEIVKKGEIDDVEIISWHQDDEKEVVGIRFDDGSCCCDVHLSSFEIIDGLEELEKARWFDDIH